MAIRRGGTVSGTKRWMTTTGLLASVLSSQLACLDVSPVHLGLSADSSIDVAPPVPDASDEADAQPFDARTACQDCIEYTGCKDQFDKCEAFPVCADTYVCALAKQCFRFADFKAIVDCGIGCAEAAGLRDQTSPEATAVIQVVACVQERCADVCVVK